MHPDEVARLCLEKYSALGSSSAKPHVRADGKHEWTVLAGVVLSIPEETTLRTDETVPAHTLCIALGTGVKALPHGRLSGHGDVVHDCHAEVLARRSARRWFLSRLVREAARDPAATAATTLDGLPVVFQQSEGASDRPWRIRDGVEIHLYCSTLPCGDASSRLIMQQSAHSLDDDLSWGEQPDHAGVLRGRAHSSATNLHLRTKPGRTQAEASISMSCTDKIAAWSMLGFQGALLYRWLGRLSFHSIVIGSEALCCSDQSEQTSTSDAARAVMHCRDVLVKKCRSSSASDTATMGVPSIATTSRSFVDGREHVQRRVGSASTDGSRDAQDIVPSATSLTWTHGAKAQGIVDGRRQGASPHRAPGQALKGSSRSYLCKLEWYRAVTEAEALLQRHLSAPEAMIKGTTYYDAKHDGMASDYQSLKRSLRGTGRMTAQERQTLECEQVAAFLQAQSTVRQEDEARESMATPLANQTGSQLVADAAPLCGWLVAGIRYECFSLDGTVNRETQGETFAP